MNPEPGCPARFLSGGRLAAAPPVLYARSGKLGWTMADELEKQLERIENSVAGIVEAVRKLRDDRSAAGEAAAGGINERLRRFLEKKKQA